MTKRYLLPVVIILSGIVLRWYYINWSLPDFFHPDEVRLLYAVQEISWENLNPKFFAYGSLPIYVLKTLLEAGKALTNTILTHGVLVRFFERPIRFDNFFLLGRALSAFFGSLTLIVIYLFGKRFFSRRVALFSAAFLAFTVLHIQLSHFLTVDVLLTFFVLLTLYFLASLVEGWHPFRNYLLAGVILGFALSTKINALPLYGVFLGVHSLVLLKLRWKLGWAPPPRWCPSLVSRWTPLAKWHPSLSLWGMFILALLLSGAVFFICEPYAFLNFSEFYRQVKEQSDMVRGIIQPPYVIQYEQTSPYVYYIKQFLLYAMGLPLGLLTLIGTLSITLETILNIKKGKAFLTDSQSVIVVLLLWVLPVFAIVGDFKVKFLRYMLPLIPFLCLFGAIFVERLIQRFPAWKQVLIGIVAITVGFSAFYAVAFVSIYHRDDPRKQASKWIYDHVKADSTVLTELWEFTAFVSAAGHHPGQYRIQGLDLYRPDSEKKIQTLTQQLSEGDIIILATKRLYGSILRVPERYPLTVRYYQQLFDGKLGFSPVKVFTSYPSLLGITFNDDFADESFSVYDHPKVILFQKTEELSGEKIYERVITAPTVDDPAFLFKRLLAFPALESEYSAFKRLDTPLAPLKGGTEGQSIVIWLLAVELLALIAFPLSTLTFRHLHDRGYAVSKLLGILLPAYGTWILVSLKLFVLTREIMFVTIGILSLISFFILLKYRPIFIEILRTKWRTFLIYESVFLLVFMLFLLFRAYNPDIFWSESSMDFSFLNVLMRTDTLPPPDPWISGFPLNYYYFGHYIVAMLTRLTGIWSHIAYNLAFALFPALVIVEVFSVLYNLTRRYFWGIIAVVFSSIISNLDGFYLLVDLLRKKEYYYRFFRCAHEVIPYTVHEFPFWTFIFVDLHAHLLNMPFLIAVFLIGLNMLSENPPLRGVSWKELGAGIPPLRGARGVSASLEEGQGWVTPLSLFLYTLVVGTLAVISSWDYPTAITFLLLVASVQTYRHFKDVPNFFLHIRPLLYVIGVILPGSLFVYRPFYKHFYRKGMKLGFVGFSTTQLSDFLTIFGMFFFVILSFLLLQVWRVRKDGKPLRTFIFLLLSMLGIYACIWYVFHINYATFLFVVSILLFSGYLFAKQKPWQTELLSENFFIWICLVYACMIVAGCEIVFVRDFLQGGEYKHLDTAWASYIPDWFLTSFTGEYKRMNTIFKFYIPVWFLVSFVITYILYKLKEQYSQKNEHISHPFPNRYILWIGVGFFGILFAFSTVFPAMAIYARRHHWDVYPRVYFPPTLNGLAYINADNSGEYQAIHWLNQHVEGTPVILEATGADYLYEYARISANTGLPTVLGWPSHADQREHWEHTYQRFLDIKEIYTSGDLEQVQQLLRKYRVKYIYVGKTERKDFTEEELKKFQDYPEYFEKVFQSGETIIYRVK